MLGCPIAQRERLKGRFSVLLSVVVMAQVQSN
jgi:hypothetical protein